MTITTPRARTTRSAAMLVAAATLGLGVAFGANAARADSDLIIVEEDTLIQPGGCAPGEPLVTGRIVIKNDGEGLAERRGGLLDRISKSMVAVYAVEAIDTLFTAREFTRLNAKEAQSIFFTLAEDVVKIGRIGETTRRGGAARGSGEAGLNRDGRRLVQRALTQIGFSTQGVDGIFGSNTRSAIRRFQAALNAPQTGALTSSQLAELRSRSNLPVPVGGGSGGAAQSIEVTIVIIADPYDVVAETDESNNVYRVPMVIDCV